MSIIPDPFSHGRLYPSQSSNAAQGKIGTAEAFNRQLKVFMLARIGDDFLNASLCGWPTAGIPLMSLVCSCWLETFKVPFSFRPSLSLTDAQR